MLDILIFLKNNDEVICYDVIDIFWWISIQDKIIRFDSDSTAVLCILSNALFRNIPSILFKILYTFFATDSRIGKKKEKKNIQL